MVKLGNKKEKSISYMMCILDSIFVYYFIFHFRLNSIIMIVFLLYSTRYFCKKIYKKMYSRKDILKSLGKFGIGFYLLLVISSNLFNWLMPYRPIWEYHSNIKKWATESEEYQYFPSFIPKGATNVKYLVMPTILQGRGVTYIMFHVDKEIISMYKNEYASKTVFIIYPYDENCNVENKEERENEDRRISFALMPNELRDYKNVTTYLFYDEGNWNHPSQAGMLINEKLNIVCFFKIPE